MKKRIVALILTVVMSLLALTSCGGFSFTEENLDAYASFDYDAFKAALQKLEIEDSDFTTNSEIREKITAAKVYNTIADKIVADTDEEDYIKSGALTAGDVLYFVYYAVDADNNVYFGSNMNESSITASSTKASHVLKLGDYFGENYDEFLKLVYENLAEGEINVYSMLTADELKTEAEKALKAEKPEATLTEIDAAKAEAIKVKNGDVIYISYTRTYKVVDAEGVETTVTEKAAYEMITLDENNEFHSFFLAGDSVANVGGTLEVFESKEGDKVNTKKTFTVGEYTYSDVKILWKVESQGSAIATFKYTPYVDESETPAKKEVTPDSCYNSANKVDLMNKELTYYVYPVYAVDTPSFEEITAEQILYYIYGSKLTEKSFDAFKTEGYVNGEKKLADLLANVADIYATSKENNSYYAEGTELKTLLDAYNKAVEAGGDNPTTAQKATITEAQTALTEKQNETLKPVLAQIAACTSGEKVLGAEIIEEYEHNTYHSLKETYDSEITDKVEAAVWQLILDSVKVTSYPEELVEEYVDHLYESYEYDYYKGDFDSKTSNYDKYASFTEYLEKTLKVTGQDKIDEALVKEAKAAIEPLIKLYVVAKACESDAVKALTGENGYIELDIKGGAYRINEEAYRETYGDKADEKIAEAKKNAEESIASARAEAGEFLVDDEYMNNYKKEIGTAYYNELIATYGEINLRAAFQFNRLFYYLTSTNFEYNEDEGHVEIKYTEDGSFIEFRTVKYTIKVEDAETEGENN